MVVDTTQTISKLLLTYSYEAGVLRENFFFLIQKGLGVYLELWNL